MRSRRSRGRGIIVGRRCPKIQLCPRCGEMRVYHPGNRLYDCPVPDDVLEALREFRSEHGVRWKHKLCRMWAEGKDEDKPLLRRARNAIGPTNLYKLDLDRRDSTRFAGDRIVKVRVEEV